MVISEGLGFSHFPSIAQMLSFTACIKTAANLMLGGKRKWFSKGIWKFGRDFFSMLILIWHVRLAVMCDKSNHEGYN